MERRGKIGSAQELEASFDTTMIGAIPLQKLVKGQPRRLVMEEAPVSDIADAYRMLRVAVESTGLKSGIKTVLVTSAAPGDGRTTVAANLADAFARAGKRVVLVSADFRRPATDEIFGVNSSVGLSDVLMGSVALKDALQRPGDDQLLVLASGKIPPNPFEFLASDSMRDVLKALGEWGDWVFIDAPSLLSVSDPAAVARVADAVLLVSRAGVTTHEDARKAAALLRRAGANVIGAVANGVGTSKRAAGSYAIGYDYASYYAGAAGAGAKPAAPAKKAAPAAPAVTATAATAVAPAPVAAPQPVPAQPAVAEPRAVEIPQPSRGRRVLASIGRILLALLAVLVVLAIAAAVLYFLDGYFGWGITPTVTSTLRPFFGQ